MAEIEKTPTLGLNKPPKGYFDWDVPLNENWDMLDFLGAGQLPLLSQIQIDHKLEGNEALGWAMQGSTLDGDVYTSVWEKLKVAKDRATQVITELNDITYTYYKDATTGWIFLDQANYNKAFENLKDSLGFVVSDVDGVKTIILPKREVFLKPSISDVNLFKTESLPNITGIVGRTTYAHYSGAFYLYSSTSGGRSGDSPDATAGFDASRSSPVYQNGAKVQPDHTSVFIYYKVGNTIVSKETIDLGNILEQITELKSRDYVVESYQDGANWYKLYKSGWIEQGSHYQTVTADSTTTITLLRPFADTNYSVFTQSNMTSQASGQYNNGNEVSNKQTTTFDVVNYNYGRPITWYACGQGVE